MIGNIPSYVWEALAIWSGGCGAALALHFGAMWWRRGNRRRWWRRSSSWRFPHGLRLQ
jgi:hypothetical protein